MLRRHLRLARAASALGLMSLAMALGTTSRADDRAVTEADAPVSALQAQRQGLLDLRARGQGEDRVHLSLRNTSGSRLNVVLPPGLVAAAGSAQFGGFQSMGLGTPTDSPGAFGEFRRPAPGFQALPVDRADAVPTPRAIALNPGQAVELDVPAVCLNFGIPTPTPRNEFRVMEVEEYTQDARARKALRSVATLGTSQKVAQAVAWHTFNGMPYDLMATRAAKILNVHEIALAARFTESLDESGAADLVDPAYLEQGRMFVRVRAQDEKVGDVSGIVKGLEELRLVGLPIQVVDEPPTATSVRSALFVEVTVNMQTPSLAKGRLALSYRAPSGAWRPLGKAEFETEAQAADAAGLVAALDTSIASTFVKVKTAQRSAGLTSFTLENRLPLTIAHATIRTGADSDAGQVDVEGLGISPTRNAIVKVPAATARVERIVFNGL